MCRIFEEYGDERAAEAIAERNIEFAEDLLRESAFPMERIAAIAQIPLDCVQQLAEKMTVSAKA